MKENRIERPKIDVGILSKTSVKFTLKGAFQNSINNNIFSDGVYAANIKDGKIYIEESSEEFAHLIPLSNKCSFVLHDVTIGVNFHWQRDEDQEFAGELILKQIKGKITAINRLHVDDYLLSVISSEMCATSSLELLKAHAIISRSWLLAQIEKTQIINDSPDSYNSTNISNNVIVKWYDREDHEHFHVCADDHCQRYQGITKVSTSTVKKAIEETKGLVLMYQNNICDARFSKCCGGVTELFENCWEPVHHNYLQAFKDQVSLNVNFPDLTNHNQANEWINHQQDVFCNSSDPKILSQVLNDYDQETQQFFRWKVTYHQSKLSDLIQKRTEVDFGKIKALVPIERGTSGRIIRLRIEGTKKTMEIGKELEIRKALSETHLYSSAFIVDFDDNTKIFTLKGAGWGHGVGLCQIGAAVMGAKGFSYKEILNHYFRGAAIEMRY